jgi:hypothetical protein
MYMISLYMLIYTCIIYIVGGIWDTPFGQWYNERLQAGWSRNFGLFCSKDKRFFSSP